MDLYLEVCKGLTGRPARIVHECLRHLGEVYKNPTTSTRQTNEYRSQGMVPLQKDIDRDLRFHLCQLNVIR